MYWSLQFSLLLLWFQNLYEVILALLWQYYGNDQVSGHLFIKTSTISLTLIFREFIFNFDVCCVSRKFTTYSCLHLSKKLLLMRFILSVVLERTVTFLTTVDVVLEEYNNYLPNNKWLGFKHISIVFRYTYIKGALLMISSTSNNTFCSSSKWFKKNKWLQKIGESRAPRTPLWIRLCYYNGIFYYKSPSKI